MNFIALYQEFPRNIHEFYDFLPIFNSLNGFFINLKSSILVFYASIRLFKGVFYQFKEFYTCILCKYTTL